LNTSNKQYSYQFARVPWVRTLGLPSAQWRAVLCCTICLVAQPVFVMMAGGIRPAKTSGALTGFLGPPMDTAVCTTAGEIGAGLNDVEGKGALSIVRQPGIIVAFVHVLMLANHVTNMAVLSWPENREGGDEEGFQALNDVVRKWRDPVLRCSDGIPSVWRSVVGVLC
jgi:hypothetical protein